MKYRDLFGNQKPVMGVVHLNGWKMPMFELAQLEIELYLAQGVFPLIENYYGTPEDCQEVLSWLQRTHPDAVYGVNVMGDISLNFEMAQRYGAKFMQIDSVCGHLLPLKDLYYGRQLERYRKEYQGVVLGGVRFKNCGVRSGRPLESDLRLGMQRCDALVCSGEASSVCTPFEKLETFKRLAGDFPVVVGSGVCQSRAMRTCLEGDGAIVGSWFKVDHSTVNQVDAETVRLFMEEWQKGNLKSA